MQAVSAARSAFSFPVRVYYEDTDAAGVVYYANYLKFMERARTEWLEGLGFPLAAFEREHGVAFVVRRAGIDFLAPARLNDRLDVTVEVLDRGASRIELEQKVLRGAAELATAHITLACLDTARWRPTRLPGPLAGMLPIASRPARPGRRAPERPAEFPENTEQETL
jgi:acyl-CoA thioester hydrolase